MSGKKYYCQIHSLIGSLIIILKEFLVVAIQPIPTISLHVEMYLKYQQ